jgi:hypothetical protein
VKSTSHSRETVRDGVIYEVRPEATEGRLEKLAGPNISTVALRDIGGEEKGTQCLGV